MRTKTMGGIFAAIVILLCLSGCEQPGGPGDDGKKDGIPVPRSIGIGVLPDKVVYAPGAVFDPSGMEVLAVWPDGAWSNITGYRVAAGNMDSVGIKTVTVTYLEREITFEIMVTAGTLSSIAVETPPAKLKYGKGQPGPDITGLRIAAAYSDCDTPVTMKVKADQVTGFSSASEGQGTLTISFGGKTVTQSYDVVLPRLYFEYGRRFTDTEPPNTADTPEAQLGVYTAVLTRPLVLAPIKWYISDSAVWSWQVEALSGDPALVPGTDYTAVEKGEYLTFSPKKNRKFLITVTAVDSGITVKARTIVHCTGFTAPKRAKNSNSIAVAKFGSYSSYPETAAPSQRTYNQSGSQWRFSLGVFGGYWVFTFDHSVERTGGYELRIDGNQFQGSEEPGIVWVAMDDNGNGLPDDTWYELRGSETGNAKTCIQRYSVTYFRGGAITGKPASGWPPTAESAAQRIRWEDNLGNSGLVSALSMWHNNAYGTMTFAGTNLASRVAGNYDPGSGSVVTMGGYDWGYVDNIAINGSSNMFDIDHAMQADGTPVTLQFIDFVKVQTGPLTDAGILGEVSTELVDVIDRSM